MTDDRTAPSRQLSLRDGAVLAGLALFACLFLPAMRPALALAGALLLAVSVILPRNDAAAAGALTGALCLYAGAAGQLFVWPAYLAVPIAIAFAAGALRGFRSPFTAAARLGRLGRAEWGFIALVSLASGAALYLWVRLLSPDLARFAAMIPTWGPAALVAAALGFSVINAALEEYIWRGVLQNWLLSIAPPAVAIALQALSFGAAHVIGFPGGLIGALLAALYGAMLGALALRCGGLLAPVLAHIAADLVIFVLVASELAASG